MPRTLQSTLKRQVYTVEEGIRLGRPQDMLIDPDRHEVAAVILVDKMIPQTATVIAAKDVRSFAEDTIAIAGLSAVHLAYQERGFAQLIERGHHFKGRDIITSDGHNVGRIVHVLIDDGGKVVEYRVAKGLLRRLLRLTKPVLPSELLTSGGEVAVVEAPQSEPGGEEVETEAERATTE